MISLPALDAHFASAIGVLTKHAGPHGTWQTRDGLVVTAVGQGGSTFNSAWVLDEPTDPAAATAWAHALLKATGQPYELQVPAQHGAVMEAALAAEGLQAEHTRPGMVRRASSDVPAPPAGLRIVPVKDPAALETFAMAMATGFGAPDARATLSVFPRSVLEDERIEFFSGYLPEGAEPIATSACVVAEGVAGIYGVTVHEAAQRQGIGAAMTWAAVASGARRGAALTVLQATPAGRPVYERMGFQAVQEYVTFSRPE